MPPPSAGFWYGAVPCWKIGIVSLPWISWNSGSAATQARAGVPSSQGEVTPVSQRVSVDSTGAGWAATADARRAAWPGASWTVKTAAAATAGAVAPRMAIQSRSGWYAVHAAASALSVAGAAGASSAVRSESGAAAAPVDEWIAVVRIAP